MLKDISGSSIRTLKRRKIIPPPSDKITNRANEIYDGVFVEAYRNYVEGHNSVYKRIEKKRDGYESVINEMWVELEKGEQEIDQNNLANLSRQFEALISDIIRDSNEVLIALITMMHSVLQTEKGDAS